MSLAAIGPSLLPPAVGAPVCCRAPAGGRWQASLRPLPTGWSGRAGGCGRSGPVAGRRRCECRWLSAIRSRR